MKKILSLVLILTLTISLAACGNDKEENTSNNSDGKLSGDVVVWSWDVAAKSLEDAAKEFEKQHPDVTVKVEDLGVGQVYDRLLTRLASKTGLPDVITMEGERVATYAAKFPNGFADLTEHVNTEDFLDVKISEVTYNDKVVAFPWDGAPTGLYYRADLFEEAGINPDDIKTWDDFIKEGEKMKELGIKMMPLAASKNPTFFGMLYEQTGSYFFDEKGNPTVNSEKGMKAANTLKKLYDSGVTFDNQDWDGMVSATKEGKIATVPSAVWWAGTLQDEVKDSAGDWRVMKLPVIEEGLDYIAVNGGSNVLVPEDAPNKQAAIEFVKFAMTDIDNQVNAFDKYGLYPSYKATYNEPTFDKELEYFGGQKVWRFFADISEDIPKVNYSENFDEAIDQIRDAQAKMLLKDASVEKTLDDLQEKFKKDFK
ncbi:ABC transporter substrate-binding protein [Senegalia massiliensis]|uniref:Extracellular solute-binding protein n=1 Tax=Senegalia massiliensis TaxID=1720316 RepID=A0A845QUH7_9CLOT|nr:sugar ABC transporter substrate-binding protein [Senegalia massiliensis]NBI05891.1 extracellular solute-binding protein [Senegalia massiliensis]